MADRLNEKLLNALTFPATGNSITYDSEVKGFGVELCLTEAQIHHALGFLDASANQQAANAIRRLILQARGWAKS